MTDERSIQEVMARYVRAVDSRDGEALAALFVTDATVEMHHRVDGVDELAVSVVGERAIGESIGFMAAHPPRGWSHHTTHDPLITVDGDEATFDAQFVVFDVLGDEQPAGGWPAGTSGSQGTITPIESGYYRPRLRRTNGAWKVTKHRIFLDMPFALPTP